MKKFLSKLSFCSIIALSCICFTYVNTTDLESSNSGSNMTEMQSVNDNMIGSVKTATVLFSKAFDFLASRKDV